MDWREGVGRGGAGAAEPSGGGKAGERGGEAGEKAEPERWCVSVEAAGGGVQEEGCEPEVTAGRDVEAEGVMDVARHPAAMWAGMVLKSGMGWPVDVDA